jgi:hypothetical protein
VELARFSKLLLVTVAALAAAVFVASCGGDDDGGGGDFSLSGNADQFAGPTPLISRFSAEAKNAEGDVRYRWRFDDGTISEEQNPTHTFRRAGYYTVILDARDEANNNDRETFLLGAWTPTEWANARRRPLTKENALKAQEKQQRRTDARYREIRQRTEQRAREQTQG